LLFAGDAQGPVFRGPCGEGSDIRRGDQREICDLGREVEALGVLPGFAAFLIPTAFIESRFNPNAGSSGANNKARGWYGLRPQSAFNFRNDLTQLQSQPNLLKDPRWATAMAADYARRLIVFNTKKSRRDQLTWKDIRRGWALPKLTDPSRRGDRPGNLTQFRNAIKATGTDPALADARVLLGDWPGTRAVLEHLGVKAP
jgi:hypothetical protein